MKKTVHIIGGGASGFFCAINLAERRPDLDVIILEKSTKLLSKVKVSGGGRCNVTHDCYQTNELVKNYPRGSKELKGIFSRFSTQDTINWFAKHDVKIVAERDGRMFPNTDNSQTIIDCFLQEAEKLKIKIIQKAEVVLINPIDAGMNLSIRYNDNDELKSIQTNYLVIASGGFPTGKAYDFIKPSGHSIESPIPSLFTFNIPNNPITQLMGVALSDALVKISGTNLSYSGPLLITHWGFSGPAVLKLSAFAAQHFHKNNYEINVVINWLNLSQEEIRKKVLTEMIIQAKSFPRNTNFFNFPKRLWEFILEKAEMDALTIWNGVAQKKINKLIEILSNDVYEMKGKTTFKEEFVTCGGVPLKEVDCRTMQSKISPFIFFTGEVLNIDGITGGFNFQVAWSTAWIAANSI